ncbi:MAG: DUF6265 family protein [Acidobacteriota bacterium]
MKTLPGFCLLLVLLSLPVLAQEKQTEHTLKLSPGQKSPAATIADMAWYAGHWTGEGLGGFNEEIWSPPQNGSMMGVYRMMKNGKPVFYELLTLLEENGSLIIRLKHFNPDLTGWEEKEKSIAFPLVAKKDGMLYFDGITFKPEGKDAVTIYLAIENRKEGKVTEAVFRLTRVNPAPNPIPSGVNK